MALWLADTSLHAIIDRDSNQLSDVWQMKFSTGTLNPDLDADGDGLTNRQENILGTNPLDATSRLNPPVNFSAPGSFSATWDGEPGKRYVFETSTDLTAWTAALTLYGTGAPLSASADTGGTARFFVRVKTDDLDTDGDGLSDWEEYTAGFNPLRIFSEGIGNTSTNVNVRVTDFERVRDLLEGTAAHTVTIAAADPAMAENWPDPGTVVIRRTGRLSPVTVVFTLSGTAVSGIDYASPAFLSATIPLGADETTVSFAPLTDALDENDETIVVTLQPGAGYTLGTATAATLTITDDDGHPAAKAASRFLTQATFGPAPAELARVQQLGFSGWLDDQFTRAPNLHLPIVQTWQTELGDGTSSSSVSTEHRLEAFWRQSMRTDAASDPLRQRTAFALSQIFVISDRMESLASDQRGMTGYYDTLLENAFGNYRTLLEAVTRHPWMGLYLSALRNRKANVAANRFPDENYAREVMQLFAIGLWRLNPDGSQLLSSGTDLDPDGAIVPAGQPIPTYGQSQIEVLARVFTGLSYGTRFTSTSNLAEIPTTRFNDSANVSWRPMRMFDVEHDVAAKTLAFPGLPPLNLPARTASGNPDTGAAGDADLAATLDHLANHPNVGPFIARLLIQRLVTSNPTPAYIGRVSAAFANNGSNVRGDLKAVLKAILLDPEARDPARLDVATHGLVREPYTRYVAAARAFNAAPADPVSSGGRFRGFGSVDGDFLQRPLSAPSVFNFYSPDYRPPGAARDAGLVSPELQIINSVTSISAPNRFSTAFAATRTTADSTQFNQSTQSDNAATPDVNESTWNTRADEAAWLPLATGDPDALVAALDRSLCSGRMSPVTFRAVTRAVRRLDDPLATADPALRDQRARIRLRIAAHLVTVSADFSVLK
jgi:uncharacterized protein (DUF1800 family)